MPIKFLNDVAVDTSVLYVDTINDRVGIGTTSPGVKLDIVSSSSGSQIELTSPTPGIKLIDSNLTTRYAEIKAENGNVNIDIDPGQAEGTSYFSVDIDNSEKFRITKDGNVGIGTTNPETDLMIYDTVSEDPAQPGYATTGMFALNRSGQATLSVGVNSSNVYWMSNVNRAFTGPNYYGISLNPLGGNVGIGTTSPSQKLEVVGDDVSGPSITWKQTNRRSGYLYSDSSGVGIYDTALNNAGIYLANNSRMDFRVNGYERMRITSSGNVGIGTTSPGSGYAYDIKLDIVAPQLGGIPLRLIRDSSVVNYGAMIALAAKNSASEIITYGAITGGIVDSTDGSEDGYVSIRTIKAGVEAEKVRVDESGNVGIGTTSPSDKLDVFGDFRVSYDSSNYFTVEPISNGNVYFKPTGGSIHMAKSTKNNQIFLYDYTGASARWGEYDASSINLKTSTNTTGILLNTDGNSYINSGNVGIGTTSPTTTLDIRKSLGTGFIGDTNSTLRLVDTSTGLNARQGGAISLSGVYNSSGAILGGSPYIRAAKANANDGDYGFGLEFGVRLNGSATPTAEMVIDQSGNVGIGTTDPNFKTHLYDSGNTVLGITAGTNNYATLQFGSTSDATRGAIEYFTNDDSLRLKTGNNSEKVRIDSSGNVGIGTTSPAAKLQIASTGANPYSATLDSSSNMKGIRNVLTSNTDDMVGVYFATGTTTNGTHWSGITGSRSDNASHWGTQLNFYTHNNDLANINHATQKMVIKGDGNVGIGTTSPSQKLQVAGNARVTGAYYDSNNSAGTSGQVLSSTATGTDWIDGSAIPGLVDGTGTANYVARWTGTESIGTGVLYDNGSNVGISATSLSSKLHIGNSSNSNNNLLTMEANGPVWVHLKTPPNTQSQIGFGTSQYVTQNTRGRIVYNSSTTTANNYMSFVTNFAEVMRITNSNVGIGTTSPAEKLAISGSIRIPRTEEFYWTDGSVNGNPRAVIFSTDNEFGGDYNGLGFSIGANGRTAPSMYIRGTGNVGIGTTSPGAKLTVVDDILLTGSSPSLTLTDASSSFVIKTNTAGEGILQTSGTSKPIRFFRNNGSNESMRIDGAGNVGIGTTSPSYKLEVADGDIKLDDGYEILWDNNGTVTAGEELVLNAGNTDSKIILDGSDSAMQFITGNSTAIVINDAQNVGIGTTSPSEKLNISGGNLLIAGDYQSLYVGGKTDSSQDGLRMSIDNAGNGYFDHRGAGNLNFRVDSSTGASTRMVINSIGNVGIGTTSPSYQLQLSTNSAAKPTSSSWTVVSDERVKTNIRPYETGLDKLLQIEPKLFDYNGKAGFDTKAKNNIGVIAQEIKDIMPETVKKYNAKLNEKDEEDTELYNFDSHALTFALINSVKELNAKIESLESRIQTLENQ